MPSAVMANPPHDGPMVKRQKLDQRARRSPAHASRIFAPFRTFGLVSPTAVPFTSIPLGKTTFQITTSAGRCLQTYDLKRGLNLVFLTRPQTPQDITATLAWKDRVLAAWHGSDATGIWVFKRGKKLAELEMPDDHSQPIRQLLVFGSWIVGGGATRIDVWKSDTYEHYTTLYPTAAQNGGHELTGGICSMPTYLNKIMAGRKDGSVEIWNVSTGKRVYTILPPTADCGAVTAMQSTPALSLLAIAYSGGPLIVHNILEDKVVLHLSNSSSDAVVTSISFRTDGLGAGQDGRMAGVMATATTANGDVTFWDLNKGGRVMGVLRGAHNPPSSATDMASVGGGVSKVEFLPGQPVIITSGLDNSLKSWIFDETPFSPVPRILHTRSGHAAPVTRLQFLPTDSDGADAGGKWLLSSAQDRSLWAWSLRRDGQSTELSQGNIRKKAKKLGILAAGAVKEQTTTLEDLKAPEITCMASSLNRDGGMGAYAGGGEIWQKGHRTQRDTDAAESGLTGWESVVTGHRGDKYARTWFWGRKKAGRWAFETGDGANVSSVSISSCGTFAIVGSEAGGIDTFNLQSGRHRKRFPVKLTPAQARKLKADLVARGGELEVRDGSKVYPAGMGRHSMAVTGLMVDSMNKHLISCSLDGTLKFWDFATGHHVAEMDSFGDAAVTSLRYHAPSDLVAVSTDSNAIFVVDIETRKVIRELWGFQDRINDLCFSSDGRWIIAASQDRTVRVWDLPTGHLVDAIRMRTPCTALACSGTGEFLATACDGDLGVSIWNNKALFSRMPTKHISEAEIAEIMAPTASGDGGQGVLDAAFEDEDADADEEDDAAPVESLEQLSKDMMTLSLVPKSRWQTLLHLDLIKQRNKPTEAPKAPEKAPFFLPSLENGRPSDALTPFTDAAEQSRVLKMDRSATEGKFTLLLREAAATDDYTHFLAHLTTLSPAATDLEIRSLSGAPAPRSERAAFVAALTARLAARRDYELVHAWMAVFLRLHADALAHDAPLADALAAWRAAQAAEAARLDDLVGWCTGVVGFVRSARR